MTEHRAFTIQQVCERFQISLDTCERLIRRGDLRAIDVAAPGAKRRCWRIPADALLSFETTRSHRAVPKPSWRRREPGQVAGGVDDHEGGASDHCVERSEGCFVREVRIEARGAFVAQLLELLAHFVELLSDCGFGADERDRAHIQGWFGGADLVDLLEERGRAAVTDASE